MTLRPIELRAAACYLARMARRSNYDKFPAVSVPHSAGQAAAGWRAVQERLQAACAAKSVLIVETYPGVIDSDVLPHLRTTFPQATFLNAADALLAPAAVDALVAADVTEDPVFGRLSLITLEQFFDPAKLAALRAKVSQSGLTVLYGVGAAVVHPPTSNDVVVYADMARWELQLRQRNKLIGNLGAENLNAGNWYKYKRAFFVDWRAADRLKRQIFSRIDLFLDTHDRSTPKLATAAAVRSGLSHSVTRPFRVVPFFDPGVWGGQWMKEVCDLDRSAVNYAWCFDCVPEENSLLLNIGDVRLELPSINLVFEHASKLMGDAVYSRFGNEFPIRFDFLDTFAGGNLSLQVHPLTDYIRQHFNMPYTQDESYYMLDAEGDACVYLGFIDNVSPTEFLSALQTAQADPSKPLQAEKFVNKIPAKKHDHFLIPAGTIHCSGKDSMVLEISATPYIFTFKLWDWSRLDLDGKPRPISLRHGAANLQYDRNTAWTNENLVNRFEPIASGPGWTEERTGLHPTQFIETRRYFFTSPVRHNTGGQFAGGVNVLNLIEGESATVTSPSGAFEPFEVHYAETWIVPAAVGEYIITPAPGARCGTLKAFVRT